MKRIIFLIIFAVGLFAQDQTLSIQGVLRQPSGKAVADGTYSITFNFYNVANGGSPIASRVETVEVKDGLYTANVDISGIPFNEQYWIGIQIGSDNELTPRAKLTAAPYALALKGLDNEFPSTGTVAVGDSLRVGGDAKISGNLEVGGVIDTLNIGGRINIAGKLAIERDASDVLRINDMSNAPVVVMKGARLDLYAIDFRMGQLDGTGAKRIFSPDPTTNTLRMNYAADFDKVEVQSELSAKMFSIIGQTPFRLLWARVDNNGNVVAGSGLSVWLNTNNYVYTVTYDQPFTVPPAVIVTALDNTQHDIAAHTSEPTDNKNRVYVNLTWGAKGNNNNANLPMSGFSILVFGY